MHKIPPNYLDCLEDQYKSLVLCRSQSCLSSWTQQFCTPKWTGGLVSYITTYTYADTHLATLHHNWTRPVSHTPAHSTTNNNWIDKTHKTQPPPTRQFHPISVSPMVLLFSFPLTIHCTFFFFLIFFPSESDNMVEVPVACIHNHDKVFFHDIIDELTTI